MSSTFVTNAKGQYSKILSTLFCSNAIIGLSILCLLNNLSFDIYSLGSLISVVIPASFCFWFLGFIIGKILDGSTAEEVKTAEETESDDRAYEIPSIFSDPPSDDSETSVLE